MTTRAELIEELRTWNNSRLFESVEYRRVQAALAEIDELREQLAASLDTSNYLSESSRRLNEQRNKWRAEANQLLQEVHELRRRT